nr:MAG TPA: hypothetical protein [Caudoviricetes sp.]
MTTKRPCCSISNASMRGRCGTSTIKSGCCKAMS